MAKSKIETAEMDETAARVRDARVELMRLRAELVRCTSAVGVGAEHADALEQLREQRRELLAAAYADDVNPDTSEVDTAIAEHERKHAAAIEAAAVARDAAVVIEARIEAQQDLMEPLVAEWREHAQQAILRGLDATEEKFARALDALAGPVAEFTAYAKVWRELTGKPIPADGREELCEAMRGVPALRVRWDFSPLKHPELSARFASESYQGAARFVPDWLAPDSTDFAARETAALRALLHIDDVGGTR
ncbi:hypothetical protein P5W99_30035 [Paraburkholderia sp. A3BS-1L]|uniref:hypothetical protein n=1 Tax=Paraburkholderia sp. A3BS-1L TaxID=3028375 RepID=UPI003DA7D9D1